MALNIKDPSVHETVRQIAKITGESQAEAVDHEQLPPRPL